MDRGAGHLLAVGCVVAAGVLAIVAAAITLEGFRGSGSGDLVVSSAMGNGLSLALLLLSTLALLFLVLRYLPSRGRSNDEVQPAFAPRGRSQRGASSRAWRPRSGPR
jgi:hypothetical protein